MDPLKKSSTDQAYELFKMFGAAAHGFTREQVIDAASNLLVNAIRQEKGSWQQAEPAFDELFGKLKTILREHFDAVGTRRNVFPFTQNIIVPLLKSDNKFFPPG